MHEPSRTAEAVFCALDRDGSIVTSFVLSKWTDGSVNRPKVEASKTSA